MSIYSLSNPKNNPQQHRKAAVIHFIHHITVPTQSRAKQSSIFGAAVSFLDVQGGHSKLLTGRGSAQPDPTLKLGVGTDTGSCANPNSSFVIQWWRQRLGGGGTLDPERQSQMSSLLLFHQKWDFSQLRWKAQGHLGQGHRTGKSSVFPGTENWNFEMFLQWFWMFASLER